jgi:predicted alpha-1,2-mannosidase
MKIIAQLFFALLITLSAHAQKNINYVDPFIGTGGHGHTYPGAVVPHGMVQLSPDTRLEGWDGCGGYHYDDNYIYGFSHTHLSGTGCIDYGDILLAPMTGTPSPNNKIYGSKFSHTNEKASPGFYAVKLEDDDIDVALTATARVGLHQYTFNNNKEGSIILDLVHRDEVIESSLKIINNKTITGLRRSKNWAVDQYVYFAIEFSEPFIKKGIWENDKLLSPEISSKENSKSLKAFFTFKSKKILVKVALSGVDEKGAQNNLAKEMPGWDFEKIKKDAENIWEKELSKIEVASDDVQQLGTFYTALYHTQVVPCINMDVDNKYRGRDNKIYTANGFTYYSVFSLWDTYRAANPLYTITDRGRTLDYIKTFLEQYKQAGRLPVWELSSNETDCMIGYHSIPVIVDAYKKGINQFDTKLAFEAMNKSATWNHNGLPSYLKNGFIDSDDEGQSVSRTLEYAYDDWCIAQFAKDINYKADYINYTKRAQFYKNVLNPANGFMQPRKLGNWLTSFDPRKVDANFTEANSWQYSFYVPQDFSGYIKLMGGKKNVENKLDALFAASSVTTGIEQSDISGLIGQYAHGNEPSHHIAYLYNFVGAAFKTQEKVHEILTTLYHDKPDGLSGNEDCGQMSAWYVLSALGFYPVTPGSNEYLIGTPTFKKATIHLENGKKFIIEANKVNAANFYIQSAQLNNKPYQKSFLNHNDIANGGKLVFEMGNVKSDFGATEIPVSEIKDNLIVATPIVDVTTSADKKQKTFSISDSDKGLKYYYTLDRTMPTTSSTKYTAPINFDATQMVTVIAVNKDGEKSLPTAVGLSLEDLQQTVTVYSDCNFSGEKIKLAVGDYTLAKLKSIGIEDNALSSIKISPKYKLVLFADDDFKGKSVTITANTLCLVENGFNDAASSLKVIEILDSK